MKPKLVAILILMATLLVTNVNANTWSLDPIGSLEVTAGQEISFDLMFTASETLYVDGWDLEFTFDQAEMLAVWDDSGPLPLQDWKVSFNTAVADKLLVNVDNSTGYYRAAAGNLSSYYTINNGETVTFATLFFDVTSLDLFDGIADLSLLAQSGNFGLSEFTAIFNLNAADGADIGAPVPVPAAVWLLGSGLLGIIGIRRKISR